MPKLSVVIPAYNEEFRIGKSLQLICLYLAKKNYDFEIIVIDDGSADKTVEIAKKETEKIADKIQIICNSKNQGKGFSVKTGVLAATGDYVLFTDADLSTPIEEVTKLISYLENGYDIAIGSRDLPDSKVYIHQNWLRELMGKVFNKIARMLTFKDIHDSQCGFKCFKAQCAKELFGLQKYNGFSFDVEILFLAQKLGYKIKEVPVIWRNSPSSKVNIIADPLKMFRDLFCIRLTHWNVKNRK